MFNVLLVDDEVGVRNSIKAKIDWEACGFHIAYEASNGEEALRLLEENKLPDVMITDVRMPVMDGIALIQACANKFAGCGLRIVVLSGYSDFAYMKAAIQYGVKDYLLKPVVRGELTALLNKLAEEIRQTRLEEQLNEIGRHRHTRQLLLLQEQFLLQVVRDEWYSESAVRERLHQLQLSQLAGEGLHLQFVTAEMRIPSGRLDRGEGRAELMQLAYQLLCRESADKLDGVYPLYDAMHPSFMFFLIAAADESQAAALAERLMEELKRAVKAYLHLVCITAQGETVAGLKNIKNAYVSSMLAWSQSTADGNKSEGLTGEAFTPEIERKLIQALENSDAAGFMAFLETFAAPQRDMPMFEFQFLALRTVLLIDSIARKFELKDEVQRRMLWEVQQMIAAYSSREHTIERIRELAKHACEAIRESRATDCRKLVKVVRKYVEDHYAYELTLSSLADRFHLNENYLSGLFKQEVGLTFSDYLTKLRMERADELIRENELRLTDIAMLVGYSTPSYFSTAFKKYYGQSPKKYREEIERRAY